jgi:hypothetical protein
MVLDKELRDRINLELRDIDDHEDQYLVGAKSL